MHIVVSELIISTRQSHRIQSWQPQDPVLAAQDPVQAAQDPVLAAPDPVLRGGLGGAGTCWEVLGRVAPDILPALGLSSPRTLSSTRR